MKTLFSWIESILYLLIFDKFLDKAREVVQKLVLESEMLNNLFTNINSDYH